MYALFLAKQCYLRTNFSYTNSQNWQIRQFHKMPLPQSFSFFFFFFVVGGEGEEDDGRLGSFPKLQRYLPKENFLLENSCWRNMEPHLQARNKSNATEISFHSLANRGNVKTFCSTVFKITAVRFATRRNVKGMKILTIEVKRNQNQSN